jgi:membrane protein implicated in regulation of membrane protease activity
MQILQSLPPLRVDVAILLLLAMAACAAFGWWRFKRRTSRPRHTRIDIVHPHEGEDG